MEEFQKYDEEIERLVTLILFLIAKVAQRGLGRLVDETMPLCQSKTPEEQCCSVSDRSSPIDALCFASCTSPNVAARRNGLRAVNNLMLEFCWTEPNMVEKMILQKDVPSP